MAKFGHYHAIPVTLRGFSRGLPPTLVSTPHGDVEEGCFKRITSVFSDDELTIEQLIQKKEELGREYVAHLELADEVIRQNDAGRKAKKLPKPAPALDAVDAQFEKFLAGDFIGFATFVKSNPTIVAKLRTYTNGKVEALNTGTVTIKRDNNGSRVTMFYDLKTKLKVGDHVFIRDDGSKPIPAAKSVWVNVKDASLRADQLKQFF